MLHTTAPLLVPPPGPDDHGKGSHTSPLWGHTVPRTLYELVLRAVPESTGPGVRVGRVWSSGGRGFSERVAVPTRLSCPGFSRGKRVDARCDGE